MYGSIETLYPISGLTYYGSAIQLQKFLKKKKNVQMLMVFVYKTKKLKPTDQ